jgi:hypothetical protein
MIIGYIFGIPITLVAIYFCVVRPLTGLVARADSDSPAGKAFKVLNWLVLAGLIVFVVGVACVALIVTTAP